MQTLKHVCTLILWTRAHIYSFPMNNSKKLSQRTHLPTTEIVIALNYGITLEKFKHPGQVLQTRWADLPQETQLDESQKKKKRNSTRWGMLSSLVCDHLIIIIICRTPSYFYSLSYISMVLHWVIYTLAFLVHYKFAISALSVHPCWFKRCYSIL
jgi:hypothetical protein